MSCAHNPANVCFFVNFSDYCIVALKSRHPRSSPLRSHRTPPPASCMSACWFCVSQDDPQRNIPYYYNTATGETQWDRPPPPHQPRAVPVPVAAAMPAANTPYNQSPLKLASTQSMGIGGGSSSYNATTAAGNYNVGSAGGGYNAGGSSRSCNAGGGGPGARFTGENGEAARIAMGGGGPGGMGISPAATTASGPGMAKGVAPGGDVGGRGGYGMPQRMAPAEVSVLSYCAQRLYIRTIVVWGEHWGLQGTRAVVLDAGWSLLVIRRFRRMQGRRNVLVDVREYWRFRSPVLLSLDFEKRVIQSPPTLTPKPMPSVCPRHPAVVKAASVCSRSAPSSGSAIASAGTGSACSFRRG